MIVSGGASSPRRARQKRTTTTLAHGKRAARNYDLDTRPTSSSFFVSIFIRGGESSDARMEHPNRFMASKNHTQENLVGPCRTERNVPTCKIHRAHIADRTHATPRGVFYVLLACSVYYFPANLHIPNYFLSLPVFPRGPRKKGKRIELLFTLYSSSTRLSRTKKMAKPYIRQESQLRARRKIDETRHAMKKAHCNALESAANISPKHAVFLSQIQ